MPGQCIDIGKLWYANSAFTLFADLLLIAMPMKQIAKLKLPTSQRLGLIFVFSLGILYVLVTSCVAHILMASSVMVCTIIRCVMLGPTTSQKDSLCKFIAVVARDQAG